MTDLQLQLQLQESAAYNRAYYARPRRNRLAWSIETYRLVTRGKITEDEADRKTDAARSKRASL